MILKSCPFCGSEAELLGENCFWEVRCTGMECVASVWETKQENAIQLWNRRVAESVTDARRTAWEECREAAAKAAEVEAQKYKENCRLCDLGGNHMGGTLDTSAALGCERVAAAIRALPCP